MSPLKLGYGIAFALLLESAILTTGQANEQTAGAADPDVVEGERFYRAHCRICHGRAGIGDRGPSLDRGEFDRARTDDELDGILFNGIPGTGMPGVVDSQRKRRQVIAYLRSLGVRDRGPPPGNPASGAAIFSGDGGCLACHMVNGEGSPLGPELSVIGRVRAAASLRRSLLDPDADVEKRYWSARLTLRAGGGLSGTLIDEDTFSVRLMDAEGNLHAFRKSELESLQVDRSSTMTSYEDVFGASQIDDLVAYLSSLKGRK